MSEDTRSEITRLLLAEGASGTEVINALTPRLYDELREIARRHLARESVGHTLNTSDLVHEAYLDLVDQTRARINDRAHFLAASSRVMRHVLVDHARSRSALKRDGGRIRVSVRVAEAGAPVPPAEPDLLDLDRALEALREHDPEMSQIVECRFFGGMTEEEIAEALSISSRTVRRKWTRARAYLLAALQGGDGG